jgi:hypothetical protein
MDIYEARDALRQLQGDLQRVMEHDPYLEVSGLALPVVDSVLAVARNHVQEGDPVLNAVTELITPETIEDGAPIRAADALLVSGQLLVALDRTVVHKQDVIKAIGRLFARKSRQAAKHAES